MCLRVCEFWTWRLMSMYIACVGIFVAFIFGPLQTVIYLTDQHSEMSRLLNYEINLALMLWFIVAFMWLILISNIVLFFGCYFNNKKLVMIYFYTILFHLIVAFNLCIRYAILCSFFDHKCFDHSPERHSDDSLAGIGIIFAFLTYTVAWAVILFVVWNYKLTLSLSYITCFIFRRNSEFVDGLKLSETYGN